MRFPPYPARWPLHTDRVAAALLGDGACRKEGVPSGRRCPELHPGVEPVTSVVVTRDFGAVIPKYHNVRVDIFGFHGDHDSLPSHRGVAPLVIVRETRPDPTRWLQVSRS